MLLKTFKYRLYPNPKQDQLLSDTCFLCSLVYNKMLAERIETYEASGTSLSAFSQIKNLPTLKSDIPRLVEVHSQVLQDAVRRLDKAYQSFFRRVREGKDAPGFPRFRSARRYDSFTFPQPNNGSVKLLKDGTGGRLHLSKIGVVKVKMHRPMEGSIKTVTIRRKADKWYVCFCCEILQPEPKPTTGKVAGIDMGIWYHVTTSDGEVMREAPKHLQQAERKLKQLQRAVSRKAKGSSNRRKAILLLAKAHERVANQRRDTAYKIANVLLSEYDALALEDLGIRSMVTEPHYAKRIMDVGWGILQNAIEQKAIEWGREVIYVDPHNTTQLCSNCGILVPKELTAEYHNCPNCYLLVKRQINSALNILNRSGLGRSLCGATR